MSKEYTVTVYTGTPNNAGTDADVWIQLIGQYGMSGVYYLDNDDDNFENGDVDIFAISSLDLGPLQKIIIGHNNSGGGPGWFLDKVTVRDEEAAETWDFPCGRWLSVEDDDGRIVRRLSTTGVVR